MNEPGSERLGVALALVAAFGFSFKAILVKLAYPYGVDAITLLALRMVLSLPFYAVVAWRAAGVGAAWSRSDAGRVLLLGLLGYYGASLFDFLGLQHVSAGLERIVLFTYPALTLVLGAVLLGQSVRRREVGALGLTWAGIAAAVSHDLTLGPEPSRTLFGTALVLLSALCYAAYLLGAGELVARLGSVRFTAAVMLVSTVAVLAHFAATHPLTDLVQPAPVMGLALAMAVVSTVLPTFLLTMAIQRLGAARVASLGAIGPVLTIGLGWWMLGEPISAVQLVGVALVVAGVGLTARPTTNAVPAPRE